MIVKQCGTESVEDGREGVPGAYAFFARYVLKPWESCLDVGGGLGIGLRILRQRSNQVRAIDLDPRLSELGVEMCRIDDQQDHSVDWVLAVDVIEHNEDDEEFLGHLWRVARHGIYVTTPNVAHHPERNWPYHVREYTPEAFADLFDKVIPCYSRRLHYGADTYCGNMRMTHVNQDWEHQGILCFKQHGAMTSGLLRLREVVMTVMGRS